MGKAVLEVLTKHNYEEWSNLVESYLVGQDLWDVVEAKEDQTPKAEENEDQFKIWMRKNMSALHVIKIACGPDASALIRDITLAKTAWETLATKLRPRTALSPSLVINNPGAEGNNTTNDDELESIYNALTSKDWGTVKELYTGHPDILTKRIQKLGYITPLHVAVGAKIVDIVEDMVKMMPVEGLEITDSMTGSTPLLTAASMGIIRMAECMVKKNPKIISIPNFSGVIPLELALCYGNNDMARYLYSATPLEDLLSENGKYGATLITKSIEMVYFDIAIDLLRRSSHLAIAKDHNGRTPLYTLACAPFVFRSHQRLGFWQQFLYNCTQIQAAPSFDEICVIDVKNLADSDRCNGSIILSSGLLAPFKHLAGYLLKLLGTEQMYKMKLVHVRSSELLSLMCAKIETLNINEMIEGSVYDAIVSAIDRGNADFFWSLLKTKKETWLGTDVKARNIIMHIVLSRQAVLFGTLMQQQRVRELCGLFIDNLGNTTLHMAATLAPSTYLNRISGAALQMQNELQWFKEMENVTPVAKKEYVNSDGLTAHQLFTKEHKDLVIRGEKWMKETATSCTVAAALIITIMFATIFQVPGGNKDETGIPIFVHEKLFKVFIISDAISLFSSTTSVLMFLGILTSRYAEGDFLKSLPTKMIIGLSTLFFSIATMMIAFCAAILIMFRRELWIAIPIILLATIPVSSFVWMQFPLLAKIFMSTYGTSVFHQKKGTFEKIFEDD